MNRLYAYLLCLVVTALSGTFLLSCQNWDLPTKKTQRNCEKPNGTLNAVTQQKKVDFSVTGNSGTIDKVVWDFGDGTTKATIGLVTSYTYPASKTYTVKATLTNTCGQETILQKDIAVSDAISPMVTLQVVSGISTNSAASGMTITSTGNAPITSYGICWSATNQIPTINDSKNQTTASGAVSTAFPFSLTGLLPNTLYYVRSFAVNSLVATPGYSSPVQTFRTGQNPKITTNDATAVGTAMATANFMVNDPGNPIATEFGICYSSTINTPDINNSTIVSVVSPPTNANVPVALSNLTPNKTYYYRSYAKTTLGGVEYGGVKSFTTQPEVVSQDLIASVSFTDRSLQDVSDYNNNVKLVGNPTFITDHTGRPNSAIMLNGTGDYFYMPDNSSLNQTDALSISIWIKPNSFNNRTPPGNNRMQIYNKSTFSTGQNELYSSLIKLKDDIGPELTFSTDVKQNSGCQPGKGWQTFQFTSPVEVNNWYHLVFTYSGKSSRMYFNGVLQKMLDNLPNDRLDSCPGGDLKFGAQYYEVPSYFSGAMDDIRIYKRALSQAEVQTLFRQ